METVKVTMEVHENAAQTLKHSVKQTLAVFLLEYEKRSEPSGSDQKPLLRFKHCCQQHDCLTVKQAQKDLYLRSHGYLLVFFAVATCEV